MSYDINKQGLQGTTMLRGREDFDIKEKCSLL